VDVGGQSRAVFLPFLRVVGEEGGFVN
jgi:hypothetical protein